MAFCSSWGYAQERSWCRKGFRQKLDTSVSIAIHRCVLHLSCFYFNQSMYRLGLLCMYSFLSRFIITLLSVPVFTLSDTLPPTSVSRIHPSRMPVRLSLGSLLVRSLPPFPSSLRGRHPLADRVIPWLYVARI